VHATQEEEETTAWVCVTPKNLHKSCCFPVINLVDQLHHVWQYFPSTVLPKVGNYCSGPGVPKCPKFNHFQIMSIIQYAVTIKISTQSAQNCSSRLAYKPTKQPTNK